jgi:DNA-binding response OmpR family regulator
MPKALLVTDSAWVVNDVHAALSTGDWEIEDLDDPRATVSIVEELSPDAVIVDMQVSSMGGMAVIRDIRSTLDEEERPRTVLLLDRSADRFLAGRAGADASVIKPCNAAELREALR